jgi:hypothetical protein
MKRNVFEVPYSPGRFSTVLSTVIMEALMDPRLFPKFEDQLTTEKWKRRLSFVYGAVLLFLVLIVATAVPHTRTDTANRGIEHGFFSAATMIGFPP